MLASFPSSLSPLFRPRSRHLLVATALGAALGAAGCGAGLLPTSPDAGAPAPASSALTWHHDVKPIIEARCSGCHTEGGLAPIKLLTYADVQPVRALVRAQVASKLMPPWPPNDKCRPYLGDRGLSDGQIATITSWIDNGAPEGDPAQSGPALGSTGQSLSRKDMTVSLPVAYTPQLRPDDYRCFLVDGPTAKTYVTGAGFVPDQKQIVHHVITFLATPDQVPTYQKLDGQDGSPGWTCFGVPVGGPTWIAAWAPGGLGADFPAGTGIEVPQGSKFIVQVHYNTASAAPVADKSSVVFKLDSNVDKVARVLPFADPSWIRNKTMRIGAGDADAHYDFSVDVNPYLGVLTKNQLVSGKPLTIYTAALHMHTRGTRAITTIQHPNGEEECMLDIPRWDFNWQGSFAFEKLATLAPGDKLNLECHWDNSKSTMKNGSVVPPADINWGEGTGDEMCLAIYYVTQ